MQNQMRLDHVVINVRDDMDFAEGLFAKLGFTVTPRGHHTLGSINHLMMFGTDYMELIGFPVGGIVNGQNTRADLTTAAFGINGLVFKTENVDQTYEELLRLNMDGDPPKAFSRPVDLDGKKLDAKFRTVTARSDVFPEGRVYFCEHGTPELVWRAEWQEHTNKAKVVSEVVIAASDPDFTAKNYENLVGSRIEENINGKRVTLSDGACLTVCSEEQYKSRYGKLASELGSRSAIFGALVFRSEHKLTEFPKPDQGLNDLSIEETSDSLVIRVSKYDSILEFVGTND